jgi:glyoxylase-like metal-dependent hydrolase (beta-lactamase superfamily II)
VPDATSWGDVQADGMTVAVDTGAGNGKDRPGQPLFGGLSTSYLENLVSAGVQPENVDVAINTHLHADHVGWNTRRDDSRWVPTFPNARRRSRRATWARMRSPTRTMHGGASAPGRNEGRCRHSYEANRT